MYFHEASQAAQNLDSRLRGNDAITIFNCWIYNTTITYDQHGDLASLTNGEGNEVDYSNFDVLGNPRRMKNAPGNVRRVTHNAEGWKFTDANAFIDCLQRCA